MSVVVVTTDELAPGYALAGAEVRTADSAADAAGHVRELLGAGERGLIAVHEPWFGALDRDLRRRIERDPVPLVVALPAGATPGAGLERHERLRELLWRAVGYEITFDEGSSR